MSVIILLVAAVAIVFGVPSIRMKLISTPAFAFFKRVLPPISATEQEAIEAGDVWWDGDLFSGRPDWKKMHAYPKAELSAEEQAFLDHQVPTLIKMLDDYQIEHEAKDLPKEVWEYLGKEGFFSLIIPKQYGGKQFSAIANSTIVTAISTRSYTAAISVMVPNSLGPGELLMHYGTDEQKNYWLPRLADGTEIPCFALTGPEAGSDAGAIPDSGVVCKGMHEGKEVLGIRLNFAKRYITLAPVASVVGLAFKMYDPEKLLGGKKNIGITCALIPAEHKGVRLGYRHDPLTMAFMNGSLYGEDVFIPLDWIIGGPDYAGRGWRMLMECLSAGRGISLPALSTAAGHLSTRMTGAYSFVRRQFGMPIGSFEGVQESMARIGGMTYVMEATRKFTASALDMGQSPSVVTAISKYHMTEMGRKVINEAMDVHGGRGIQLGPKNYLGHSYLAMPISITVEGANILTRNLMIFGQGATRCHPYVLKEMEAAANPDQVEGLKAFDKLLLKHIGLGTSNFFATLGHGLTGSLFANAPVSGETAKYYKQLTRMSHALALCADISMLVLGGDLKRKEMISARLGDVFSHLYLASAVLKHYEDEGRQQGDLPYVEYAISWNLSEIGKAFTGFFQNFPNRILANALKLIVFPFGNRYQEADDKTRAAIAESMMTPGSVRDRLTHLCFLGDEGDSTGDMERAFIALHNIAPLEAKLKKAKRAKLVPVAKPLPQTLEIAVEKEVLTAEEAAQMLEAERLRVDMINVDDFSTPRSDACEKALEDSAA